MHIKTVSLIFPQSVLLDLSVCNHRAPYHSSLINTLFWNKENVFFNETVVLDSFFLNRGSVFSSFVLKKKFRKNSVFLIYFGCFWLNFVVLFFTYALETNIFFPFLLFFISALRLLHTFSGFLCLNLDIVLSFIWLK